MRHHYLTPYSQRKRNEKEARKVDQEVKFNYLQCSTIDFKTDIELKEQEWFSLMAIIFEHLEEHPMSEGSFELRLDFDFNVTDTIKEQEYELATRIRRRESGIFIFSIRLFELD